MEVKLVSQNDLKMTLEDIRAFDKVLTLIKEFSDKNPIRKETINYAKIKTQIQSLEEVISRTNQLDNAILTGILKKMKSIIKNEVRPKLFFIVAGHGGVIIEDFSNFIGFCEFDDPKFALTRLVERMKLALATNMPYSIEVAICCLEWLSRNYQEEFSEFIQLFNQGKFEIINPTYSQPYSLIVGAESNIKQFEYGLKTLNRLGLPCNIYYCSEVSLHPQIPQLLRGFNIKNGSLRTRLLGTCPTTHSGHINWIGLDGTSIESLTDQSGILNGEIWHGTFFREFPTLLFQAVARPFLDHIVYSSLEDFIMPLAYQEEIWRVSSFSEIFGRFTLTSEFLQMTEVDGEFKFTRDAFSLGDYIFNPTDLFLNNRNCEISLISAEIVNCILGFFDKKLENTLLEDLWAKLLLTQAHDNYAVPDMHAGDYSIRQLSKEEYKQLKLGSKKNSISKMSVDLQKEIQKKCNDYILESLEAIANHLGTQSDRQQTSFIVFNFTAIPHFDIISIPVQLENASNLQLVSDDELIPFQYCDSTLEFVSEIPPIGFRIFSLIEQETKNPCEEGRFFYTLTLSSNKKAIEVKFKENKIYDLTFQSVADYELTIEDHFRSAIQERFVILGNFKNKKFKLEVIQYSQVNRLEFVLESNQLKEIVLIPAIPILKSVINYPFGIEETRRSKIETLDFLWLQGENQGIIFLIKNSQRFFIDRDNFTLRNVINSQGKFEFAIALTEEEAMHIALDQVNSFQYRLLGIKLQDSYEFPKNQESFLSITRPLSLINLWSRNGQAYLRLFNPSPKDAPIELQGLLVKNPFQEIDLNFNELQIIKNGEVPLRPWKISTLKLLF